MFTKWEEKRDKKMEYLLNRKELETLVLKGTFFYKKYQQECKPELSDNQYTVLSYLYFCPEITSTGLAVEMQISKQQVTKLLQSLEERQLIERIYGKNKDKRTIDLHLTSKGIEYIEACYKETTDFLNKYLKRLSFDEQEIIWKAIQILLSK